MILVGINTGATYFDDFQFEGTALGVNTSSSGAPAGTQFIFNTGAQIKASTKCESGGQSVAVWLIIQEI